MYQIYSGDVGLKCVKIQPVLTLAAHLRNRNAEHARGFPTSA